MAFFQDSNFCDPTGAIAWNCGMHNVITHVKFCVNWFNVMETKPLCMQASVFDACPKPG